MGKLLAILIITSLPLCARSQGNPDTANFKREFENLLKKYGLGANGYLVNVTSFNQQGGQTALVITNNYYRDSVSDETNSDYEIDTLDGVPVLMFYPKSGTWLVPFVATDTANARRDFLASTSGIINPLPLTKVTFHRRPYVFFGYRNSIPRSKAMPLIVYMNPDNPDEMYLFGDAQDSKKTYMYNRKSIEWMPVSNKR